VRAGAHDCRILVRGWHGPIWTQQIDRWLGVESADVEEPPAVGDKVALEPDEKMRPGSRGTSTERRGVADSAVSLPPDVPDDLILCTDAEAAKILRLNVRTLQHQRWKGTGPRYVRFGRKPLYRLSDLRAYLARDSI